MDAGLVGVAEFEETLARLERDELSHARWTMPTDIFVHPAGELYSR
jgi:hypothetical protein